jgi:diguanylate cyclase (GGDEF)-like protein/PAS domain S-box-containing protein
MDLDDKNTLAPQADGPPGAHAPVAAGAASAAGQQRLQASFDQAPVGILHLDLDGFILHANRRMCRLLDFTESELTNKHFSRRLVSEDAALVQADIPALLKSPGNGASRKYEARLIRRGGTLNWALISSHCIADESGAPAYLVWWVTDLEAQRQMKDMLQLSNRALAASSNGVLIADATQPNFPIMYANPAFCQMTGYTLIDVMGRNCRFLQNDDRAQPQIAAMRAAVDRKESVHVVMRNYRKDGSLFWNELFISPVPDERGEITHYIGILNDITTLKQNEEKLAFQANHDELTGLPNRRLFDDRLQQAIFQAARHAASVAVLCLGVDNFSLLSESLGHAAGEQLLKDIAARLLGCLRSHDTVSRHGGNEFMLILTEIHHAGDVSTVCENLFRCLGEPYALAGQSLHVACSIGATLSPQDGNDGATLLRYADMACWRARELGGGRYQFFAFDMNQKTLERVGIEAALRQALRHDELQLLYQPLVDLQSGRIDSLEALLRWAHPERGLLSASDFIEVAEDSGLIGSIGDWVLRRACHDLRAWHAGGQTQLRVAINVSPKQLRERQLAAGVAAMLAEYGLPAGALSLEVREGALLHGARTGEANLTQLKAMGAGLTLDDFGTGYSSLSHLKRLPFDLVKIDNAVIRDIVTGGEDAAMTKTIIGIAHHLGIRVAAEGVETEAQCDFLKRNMCDLIQGHFFSPPAPVAVIDAMLRDGRALPQHLLRLEARQRALLLVDDEQNIVGALKRLLRRDDYQIYTANNGEEGLALLATHPIDVIVSDQRMPGMIGADFLRKAKLLYPDTIRIMLSGYTELQSVTDAVNEGAIYKFLTKPWDDVQLRAHIAEAFRLKEIADENGRLNIEVRAANHELATANRRMEELLREKQQQISRDEVSLSVSRELLQVLPLPVLGLDDEGLIAFVNGAADALFRAGGVHALLGMEAADVLPALFPEGALLALAADPPVPAGDGAQRRQADIDGRRYDVLVYPMGASSTSRGSLVALSRPEDRP